MASTLADQLIIARKTIEEQRRKWEEEYQKDLEALQRVERLVKASSSTETFQAPIAASTAHISPISDGDQSADIGAPSLIGAVLELLLSKPDAFFSPRMVLVALEAKGFSFGRIGDKRMVSVGQALRKLTEKEHPQIRMVRKGSGRKANLYQAIKGSRVGDTTKVPMNLEELMS